MLLIVLAACSSADPDATSDPEGVASDPELTGAVTAAFGQYRLGVAQGDGQAAVDSITQASREDQDRIADLARTATEDEVRALPAAEQLLVLTYRLQPDLLEADDPYLALVDAGLAGQDRSLGELGAVSRAGDDLALGAVVDPTNGATTPLRWRFVDEDGWRFDLTGAQQLVSQAIASGAARSDAPIDQVVAGTVQELSGASPEQIQALYSP